MHRRSAIGVLAVTAMLLAGMPTSGATPQRVALSPCPGVAGAWCGSIDRPLDPSDPSLGTIPIGFELHRASRRSGAPMGTIVAIEGGPGYATTANRDYYLELFAPLLRTHDLLMVDSRGTGTSQPINCPRLQSYLGDYVMNVGLCGAELGPASDVYGSAFAADDLAAVLDYLSIESIDLYGDSYGTFLAQAFALRHPDRLRTLTLDAAYPVEDQDPWYRDLNRAMRDAIESVCAEDLECSAKPGAPLDRVSELAASLRARPATGVASDGDGVRHRVTVDAGMLAFLYGSAAYGTTVYEELEAAGEAWLDAADPAPLLRLAAEQTYWGDAGPVEEFSEGLYIAVICNDYPQLWDISSPIDSRYSQLDDSIAELTETDPLAFAPFTVADWLGSPWVEYDSCINWPVPSLWIPPQPDPATYPSVPTLVLSGELDSLTSPEGNEIVASRFPESTLVSVANSGHVTALADVNGCAAGIVVQFVRRGSVGDTACADDYPSIRTTNQFPKTLADVEISDGPGTARQRRIAGAVSGTIGDLFPRWYAMYGYDGVGLRGGTFKTSGWDQVAFKLKDMRWVEDLSVSGRAEWNRSTGEVSADMSFVGQSAGKLTLSWNDFEVGGFVAVSGTIDGVAVEFSFSAP